jgi:hypothetical protein
LPDWNLFAKYLELRLDGGKAQAHQSKSVSLKRGRRLLQTKRQDCRI